MVGFSPDPIVDRRLSMHNKISKVILLETLGSNNRNYITTNYFELEN